jgi:hypothetical protein
VNGGNPTCESPRPAVLHQQDAPVLVCKRVGNRIGVGTVARFALPGRGVLVTMHVVTMHVVTMYVPVTM